MRAFVIQRFPEHLHLIRSLTRSLDPAAAAATTFTTNPDVVLHALEEVQPREQVLIITSGAFDQHEPRRTVERMRELCPQAFVLVYSAIPHATTISDGDAWLRKDFEHKTDLVIATILASGLSDRTILERFPEVSSYRTPLAAAV